MKTNYILKGALALISFIMCGLYASAQVEAGTYYLYNEEAGTFLSRGSDWGTRATLDYLGVPIEVKSYNSGTYYSLRYIDLTNKYLGDATDPYSDISTANKVKWTIQNIDGKYLLKNQYSNNWFCGGEKPGDGASLVSDSTKATKFQFISAEEYEDKIVPSGIEGSYDEVDMSAVLANADMSDGVDGWTAAFTTSVGQGSGLNEVYQGYGTLSQKVSGLPKGYYKVSMNAFFRDGSNTSCVTYANKGYRMSNAYLEVNDKFVRISDWASDRASDKNPNSMAEASELFQQDKYSLSVVTSVGDDGELEITLNQPGYILYGWFIWGGCKLTYYAERGTDGELMVYRTLLNMAVSKLQSVVSSKRSLSADLRQKAETAITDAAKAESIDDYKSAISSVNSLYDECKAYRIPVDRSNDPYETYLFVYFPSNSDENLYYAMSEDGFNYTPLNNGTCVMASDTVAIKKGIRDPHILRGEDGAYYMVATDMKCSEGWSSNRGIILYRSTDLVHWTHSTVHFPTRFPEWENVTRVWAPETIWDANYVNADGTKGRYMIYYSLLTNDGKCTYDKVYYSYANDDFTDLLTEPVYLYDRGSATIDADIVYDETDLLYHMIYKNEGSGGICQVTSYSLTAPEGTEPGSQWSTPSGTLQQTTVAVEGGGLFREIKSNTWVMMYDCYNSGYYQFCTTSDWENFSLKAQTTTSGAFTPRHGTVLPLTHEETEAVLNAFPTKGYTPSCIQQVNATAKSNVYYDLQGRATDTPSKGIYIHQGKKVKY